MAVNAEELTYLRQGKSEESQRAYEMLRWLSFTQMSISPYVKHKPATPQAFIRFPWEKTEKKDIVISKPLSETETKILASMFEDYAARHRIS